MQNGKGDKSRIGDRKAFSKGWDNVFGAPQKWYHRLYKWIAVAITCLFWGCAAPAVPVVCGLDNHDPAMSQQDICAAVAGVQYVYGPMVNVEEQIQGTELWQRPQDPGDMGCFRYGWDIPDTIELAPELTRDERVYVLVHELIHKLQLSYEDVPEDVMAAHTCPWFGYESNLVCDGMPSYWVAAYRHAWLLIHGAHL